MIIDRLKSEILNPAIVFLFGAAVIVFLYGVMKFIQNQDNEDAQEEGKRHMFWGIVGIFIMVAVYGILNLVAGILGVPPVK